jgi:hypothetical protein
MFRSRTTKSYIKKPEKSKRLLDLEKQAECLSELNSKKTQLITVMNDYLTQKNTRVETVTRLETLKSTIS